MCIRDSPPDRVGAAFSSSSSPAVVAIATSRPSRVVVSAFASLSRRRVVAGDADGDLDGAFLGLRRGVDIAVERVAVSRGV